MFLVTSKYRDTILILFSRDEFFQAVKLAYITLRRTNLKIFGIGKSRTLADFVTTAKDVQKGNTRMPLSLARLYEEDIMSDEDVKKAKDEMQSQGMIVDTPPSRSSDNDPSLFERADLKGDIEHRSNAMRRKSSVNKRN